MDGKIVGIVSLKGGVGKTTSSVNIASSLADLNKKVVVVDSNFSSPNLHLHLGLISPETTITDVLNDDAEIDDAVYRHFSGIDIIPCSFHERLNPIRFKEEMDNLKENYDFVILDSSPALNDELASVLMSSDKLVFVTTPDYPTLLSTLRAADVIKSKNIPVAGIILNKKRNKKFEMNRGEIEKAVQIPVIAELDDDVKMLQSVAEFTPVTILAPKSNNAKEYKKVAYLLAEQEMPKRGIITTLKGWAGNGRSLIKTYLSLARKNEYPV